MAPIANAAPSTDVQIPAVISLVKKRGRPVLSSAEKESRRYAAVREAVARFEVMPGDALIRQPVVCALAGVSAATIWRWVARRSWPAPKRLSNRVTAWSVADVRAALAAAAE